jgi:parvulin-like peptidyl-prolyl isomerase
MIRKLVLLAWIFLLLVCGCTKKSKLKTVVAQVNEDVITREDVQRALSLYSSSKEEASSLKRRVLDQLIERQLKLQEAERLGLTVSDEELNKRVKETMGSYPKSEFITFLDREGMNFDEWKNGIRENILMEKLLISQVYLAVTTSPNEITAYYNDNRQEFVRPQKFHIRQILVKDRTNAEEVLAALRNGEEFEELARNRSLSPDKEKGGDMGYFAKEEMLTEWVEAVSKLAPGEISYPVESPYGWHIFKLESVKAPRLVTLKEATDEIAAKLLRHKRERALREWLLGLRVRSEIKINGDYLR